MFRLLCAICLLGAVLAAQPGCVSTLGQEDFFTAKQRLDAAARSPKVGTLAAEFQQKLAAHPDDPALLYLSARSLMGKDTKQALVYLDRAASLAPNLPWIYVALSDIYASRSFRDRARAIVAVRTFHRLCPAQLEAYRLLDAITDPAEAADWAATLRPLLETRRAPEDARLWRALWAAEFRALPAAGYPRQRERVSADILRLEPLSSSDRDFLATLLDGYNLSGQAEAAARLLHRLDPDTEVRKAYDAWIAKTALPNRALTSEEQAAFNIEYGKAAAEWVKRFPDSPSAWEFRAMTLSSQPDAPLDELEKAGLEILRLDSTVLGGPWSYIPHKLRVTQYWLLKRIRPADCLRMAEEALAQIRLGPEDPNDMTGSPGSHGFSYDDTLWEAMVAVVEAAVQIRDFAKANAIVSQMQQWVDDNRAKQSDPSAGYDRFRGRYFHSAGLTQEAQGRKVDALALYLAALASGFRFAGEQRHARQLWNETGGSSEAWAILTHRPPPVQPASTPIASASTYAAWTDFGKPLPPVNLRDTAGKTWTLADFQGKTTLLNVWATWCLPCHDELPQLQKLYGSIRALTGIQVVTISVDENPGEVEPFLAARGFTFPVLLLGRPYVEAFIGPLSIPRTWIVDPAGIVRQQSVGFDSKNSDWSSAILKQLQRE